MFYMFSFPLSSVSGSGETNHQDGVSCPLGEVDHREEGRETFRTEERGGGRVNTTSREMCLVKLVLTSSHHRYF